MSEWTTAGFHRHWSAPNARCSGSSARLPSRQPAAGRDEELRAKVREVVEELDELIREAAA